MTTKIANFKEEFSAKIPALALLSNLGYTFIPPSECEALRGNTLAKKTFSFAGKQHTSSYAVRG